MYLFFTLQGAHYPCSPSPGNPSMGTIFLNHFVWYIRMNSNPVFGDNHKAMLINFDN